jgi:GNAT superfamily N-acetyltransferase
MYLVRPVRPDDFAAIAEIRTHCEFDPVTPAMVAADHAHDGTVYPFYRLVVAENSQGQVVGYHMTWRSDGMPPGRFGLVVKVHPAHRNRGAGSALYADGERLALAAGATSLQGWCRGEFAESYAWAQRRGYVQQLQLGELVLDLATWDPARFTPVLERVRAGGIRLDVLTAEAPEEILRRCYEIDCITSPEVPSYEPPMPPFAEWRRHFDHSNGPKILALAWDGDALVGLSALELPRSAGGSAYTTYTAVLKEYRGRSIALALKVLVVNAAMARGVTRLRTNNDADNPAMLAVNAKLGYRPIPGPRKLVRELLAPPAPDRSDTAPSDPVQAG